jgi:hypothetical protein
MNKRHAVQTSPIRAGDLIGDFKMIILKHIVSQLRSLSVDKSLAKTVAEDIEQRVRGILVHWNDETLRTAFLAHGMEEAMFNAPSDVDRDIRALVVVAVRNSLIEALHYKPTKDSPQKVDENAMRDITEGAAKHLQSLDLEAFSNDGAEPLKDIYIRLVNKYPLAYKALWYLGDSASVNCYWPADRTTKPLMFPKKAADKNASTCLSGISGDMDAKLVHALRSIRNGEVSFFYADSFKWVTRNIEKLYRVIDYVLCCGSAVVTYNYYISNGYISQRVNPRPPAHTTSEVVAKLREIDGVSARHYEVLKIVADANR